GARLQLFPEENHKYAFNFARGFGEERSAFLKDHVYSIQTENRWEKWLLESELAYDEDELATVIDSSHRFENLLFNMSFRDINKDFTTIANRPSNRGEIGGLFELNFNQPTYNFSSTLDVYHNRVLPNPDREGAYNYDFNTAFDVTVNDRTRWGSNVYYVYTPGDLSSRRSFRVLTNLTRSFKLAEQKELSTFIGGAFQRNRVALAPTSDFERYSLSTGFSLPILTNLRYFTNYEYSWVKETESGELLQPNVLNTGVSYNKRIGEDIHTNVSFSYRNEEKTEGLNSFLAGEDSLEASVGVTYQPTEDFEVYLDGRFRNIWSEGIDNVAFNEYDIRSGARTSWELPFSWNPQGVIKGVVFKDKNDNKIFDEGEEGVPGAKIEVGNREYLTDDAGLYYVKVRAKRINVSVDLSSLKQKQILTTPAATVVNIEPRQMNVVNFGISTESGIYGVVFYDKNENGKPDADDEFIRQVEILLDGKDAAMSGFEGDYFFKKVEPGKHTISIKIRTIPLEFLPAVKLKNEVEVAEGTTYVFHIPLRKR
ncbi:MAG: hypothetical protein KC618_07555, partial [Candidatus Omnitrophica bacterium]|nr:hypothetical protein [Candidatus Omnitrophota bacterium]